jgi:hypothetical protein
MSFSTKSFFGIVLLWCFCSGAIAMDTPCSGELIKAVRSFGSEANVIEQVTRLIAGGADVEWQDSSGKTALFYALTWPNKTLAELLLKKSPNLIHMTDNNGNSVLFYAVKAKNVPKTKFLMKYGARVDKKNNKGHYPLRIAIDSAYGNKLIAKGGFSSWPITQEIIEIIGVASSLETVEKAKKYAQLIVEKDSHLHPLNKDAYWSHIIEPLSEIQKSRKKQVSTKRQRSGADVLPVAKKRKTDKIFVNKIDETFTKKRGKVSGRTRSHVSFLMSK